MKASDILIEAIKRFEGLKLCAYRDSAGVPTIGYGHTRNVKMGMTITRNQAEDYLREDLAVFEDYVNRINVCKTQGQFDALCDFSYNLGTGNLASSTLLKYIKAGKPTRDIQKQFKKWVYAGGKKLTGLVVRRQWEADRWAQ